jgi:hypothetical protein
VPFLGDRGALYRAMGVLTAGAWQQQQHGMPGSVVHVSRHVSVCLPCHADYVVATGQS